MAGTIKRDNAFFGASVTEDTLREGVQNTIYTLQCAGIKVRFLRSFPHACFVLLSLYSRERKLIS